MNDDATQLLGQAAAHLQAGQREAASCALWAALKEEPRNEMAWLMLSYAVDERRQQSYALQQVLRINPGNERASQRLAEIGGTGSLGPAILTPIHNPANAVSSAPQEPPEQRQHQTTGIPDPLTGEEREAYWAEDAESGLSADSPVEHAPQRAKPLARLLAVVILALAAVLILGGFYVYPVLFSQPAQSAGLAPETQVALTIEAAMARTPEPTSEPATAVPPAANAFPSFIPTATAANQAGFEPEFLPGACPFDLPEEAQVDCGYVVVPEDHDGNPRDTIRLAVAVFHSTNPSAAPDPVFFLQGGPGGAAVEMMGGPLYRSFVMPITERRDLVVFDQRGTGQSLPALNCQELNQVFQSALFRTLPEDQQEARYRQAFQRCRDRLTLGGANLEAYTTNQNAADVRAVVQALGYGQINLYGVSYGTRLALTVMRDNPELVRSAVLDSVVPLEVRLFNQTAAVTHDAFQKLFSGCAADPQCSAAYPDLETVFNELVVRFRSDPIEVPVVNLLTNRLGTARVDDITFMNAVYWGMYVTDGIPILPKAIYDIRAGDTSYLELVLSIPVVEYNAISMGMYVSVNCSDHVFATTPEEMQAALAEYPDTEAYARASVFGREDLLFELCEEWGAAPAEVDNNQALAGDLPTLIFSGEYDPITPPSYGRQVGRNLKNSFFFEFPGRGHTWSTGAEKNCGLEIALAFLDDPAVSPPGDCLAGIGGAPFLAGPEHPDEATAFDLFQDRKLGLQGLVPLNWKDLGDGVYFRSAHLLDRTQLTLGTAEDSTEAFLGALTLSYQGKGLDDEPEYVTTWAANSMQWKLYRSSFSGSALSLAVAEKKGRTLFVLLESDPKEHDALVESVLKPVASALTLIE